MSVSLDEIKEIYDRSRPLLSDEMKVSAAAIHLIRKSQGTVSGNERLEE